MTKILKIKPWIGSFPLSPFLKKLDELKFAEGNRRILILTKFRVSLYTILTTYTWIGFILKRIDNDLYNDLESHKKFQLVSKGVRVTADEMPPSNPFLTNIDIVSLIVFFCILMDDIARFLRLLMRGESTPKTKDFVIFKKTLDSFEGQKLEELNRIIQNTDWYQALKDLRDHPIVHRGDKNSGIGIHGESIGIYLRYVEDKKIKETFISNLEIDKICENVYGFLKGLNEFLCRNFDYLPLEVTKKRQSSTQREEKHT
ncbi:MAG: hypothetical protein IBV52_01715 [Candidatus Bathyarchaeota archaeon]